MKRKLVPLALATMLLASAPLAWGWGCTGHEVVALVALAKLQPQVATEVQALLALQQHGYSGRFCSDLSLPPIAYFATWADDHRAIDPTTAPWHFWDIPLKLKTASAGEFCDQGCVVQALQQQIAVLGDKTKPDADRSTALLYIIHFVGDLHQPLHAEDNNDRGGNCVPAGFLAGNTSEQKDPTTHQPNGNYTPNLHAIWDTQLVENIGGVTRHSAQGGQQVQDFANHLLSTEAAQIDQWSTQPVDIVAWGVESHDVARKDPYTLLPKPIKPAGSVKPVTTCLQNNTSQKLAKKKETIQQAYITAVQSDVETQLAKAGARLAVVLNSTLQ